MPQNTKRIQRRGNRRSIAPRARGCHARGNRAWPPKTLLTFAPSAEPLTLSPRRLLRCPRPAGRPSRCGPPQAPKGGKAVRASLGFARGRAQQAQRHRLQLQISARGLHLRGGRLPGGSLDGPARGRYRASPQAGFTVLNERVLPGPRHLPISCAGRVRGGAGAVCGARTTKARATRHSPGGLPPAPSVHRCISPARARLRTYMCCAKGRVEVTGARGHLFCGKLLEGHRSKPAGCDTNQPPSLTRTSPDSTAPRRRSRRAPGRCPAGVGQVRVVLWCALTWRGALGTTPTPASSHTCNGI
jgi:hypothetical protein